MIVGKIEFDLELGIIDKCVLEWQSRPMLGLADCYAIKNTEMWLMRASTDTRPGPRRCWAAVSRQHWLATAPPLTQGFIHSKSVWRGEGGRGVTTLHRQLHCSSSQKIFTGTLPSNYLSRHLPSSQISRFVINSTTSRKLSDFSFNSSLSSRKFYHGKLDSPSMLN